MADESCVEDSGGQLQQLVGSLVVLDVCGPYIYLGTLEHVGPEAFVLVQADVHFTEQGGASSEVYIRDAASGGIYPTRERVYVMRSEVVSVSRVQDVVGA